jgi:hypothetical protein
MGSIIIPNSNPVKFVKKDIEDVGNIHLYDKYNFAHTVQDYEGYLPYYQKWVKGDKVNIQIWANDIDTIDVTVINCVDNTINNFTALPNVLPFLVNGIQYTVYQFYFDTNLLSVGRYYFKIKYKGNDDANNFYLISEPQEIVETLVPSILLKYSNSFNDFNTLFKSTLIPTFSQLFYFRVEGRVYSAIEDGKFESYEDQVLDLTSLSAKPFTSYKFRFGLDYGIPEWVGHKVNMIRSHDKIYIDGIQFTFLDKIEKKESKNYTRHSYEITARKTENEYVESFIICPIVSNLTQSNINNGNGTYTIIISWAVPTSLVDYYNVVVTNTVTGAVVYDIEINSGIGTPGPNTSLNFDVPQGIYSVAFSSISSEGLCDTGSAKSIIVDLVAPPPCVPVAYVGVPSFPNGNINIPYSYLIQLSGDAPYSVINANIPSWATLTPQSNGILVTGTPNVDGFNSFVFDITNCGGTNILPFSKMANILSTNYNIVYSNNIASQLVQVLIGNNNSSTSNFVYNSLYGSSPSQGFSAFLPAVNANVKLMVPGKTIINATCNGISGTIVGNTAVWTGINGVLTINFLTN